MVGLVAAPHLDAKADTGDELRQRGAIGKKDFACGAEDTRTQQAMFDFE